MQPHGRWVNARDLRVGDELISRSQLSLHVLGIAVRNEITTVYNLTVADYHTYAVEISEILVHNKAVIVNKNLKSPLVSEILKTKKGSIKNAPLPQGSPSWNKIANMTMEEIEAGARTNRPGYKTIKKLLEDRRFER
jgi:hypothetical protein